MITIYNRNITCTAVHVYFVQWYEQQTRTKIILASFILDNFSKVNFYGTAKYLCSHFFADLKSRTHNFDHKRIVLNSETSIDSNARFGANGSHACLDTASSSFHPAADATPDPGLSWSHAGLSIHIWWWTIIFRVAILIIFVVARVSVNFYNSNLGLSTFLGKEGFILSCRNLDDSNPEKMYWMNKYVLNNI